MGNVLNRFDGFFANISEDDWEFFAVDFLNWLGFHTVVPPAKGIDAGKDSIVSKDGQNYLVSCKHYIQSGNAVGLASEDQLIERITQHHCDHFIGFYSTCITSSLQQRFYQIQANPRFSNIKFMVFDRLTISNYLPSISTHILQKYGLPQGVKYMLHVDQSDYVPLDCVRCGKDILADDNIPLSLATLILHDNELHFAYGCKDCLDGYYEPYGWVEISQALHHEQLWGWNSIVMESINKGHTLAEDFYIKKIKFDYCIQQRIYPVGWGTWLGGFLM